MESLLVRDVMTEYVVVVRPETPFREIVDALASRRVSAVPVIDPDNRVVGVVSENDLLHKIEFGGHEAARLFDGRRRRAVKSKAAGDTAAELMTAPAITIGPDATLAEAARRMEELRVKRLPVVEAGRLVGIVSRSDVLKVYLRPDAEIARDVEAYVLRHTLVLEPDEVTVRVVDGVATLSGTIDRRSTAEIAVRLTRAVAGVVRVANELQWEINDTADTHARYSFY
jgi:CBS domain-containing protein